MIFNSVVSKYGGFIEPMGWMLVHSVWQLTLIAALFFLVRFFIQIGGQKRASSMICGWASICLAAMLIAPVVTLMMYAGPAREYQVVQVNESNLQIPEMEEINSYESSLLPNSDSLVQVDSTVAASVGGERNLPVGDFLTTLYDRTRSQFPWLVLFWLLGVILVSFRPILGLWHVRRVSIQKLSELPAPILDAAQRIAGQMVQGKSIRFAQSALVQVPTVAGFFKPIVLIPVAVVTGMNLTQLEMILAHEIAHIRRHDYLINFGQTVVETLLFYHPAVWIVSNQMRSERENCCDDLAVQYCGSAESFARTLLRLEEATGVRSPALAASGGSLVRRVRRLIGPTVQFQKSTVSGICGGVCATAAMLVILGATTLGASIRSEPNLHGVESAIHQQNEDQRSDPVTFETLGPDWAANTPAAFMRIDQKAAQVPDSDRVMATVNGQEIFESQIKRKYFSRLVNHTRETRNLADELDIPWEQLEEAYFAYNGKSVLESEINKLIVKQALVANDLEITQTDIDCYLSRKAGELGLSVEFYVKLMSQNRETENDNVEDQFALEIGLQKLVESTRDARAANANENKAYVGIVLYSHELAQKCRELALADPTRRNFIELARLYSVEPLSFCDLYGRPSLKTAASGLEPGDISEVIQENEKFIVLCCRRVRHPLHVGLKNKMRWKLDELKNNAQIVRYVNTDNSTQIVRTYSVADLIVLDPIRRSTARFDGQDWKPQDSSEANKTESRTLINTIQSTINPESWKQTRVTIQFYEPNLSLVISHDRQTHSQIRDFLESLREINGESIELRGYLIVGDKESFNNLPGSEISKTPSPLTNRQARYVRSVAVAKDSIARIDVPILTIFNGQMATICLDQFEGMKASVIRIQQVLSVDGKSLRSTFASFNGVSQECHVIQSTTSGQTVAVDVSHLLGADSDKRAVFVFQPIIFDEREAVK